MTASTMPSRSASAALIGLPVDAHLHRFGHAGQAGQRCVPAAPGIRPSLTSGWPT